MTLMTPEHKAVRQYSDQYHCSHCGKQWDVNDPNPPECEIAPDNLWESQESVKYHVDDIKKEICRDCDGSGKFYQMQDTDCHCTKPEYTQGICGDGAAILKDGKQMTIEEILNELRRN